MVTVVDLRDPHQPVRPRHPEKAARPPRASAARPPWIRVRAPMDEAGTLADTRRTVRALGLKTVCEEASCPNLAECWGNAHATFLILGEICTRACAFCNVATGMPGAVDPTEPIRVAEAVERLGLAHVVITSVDRDDLADGGASHFAAVVEAIRRRRPEATIELLTPDFLRKEGALATVLATRPDVLNHNIETVPRLYPAIRPGARYFHSLRLLDEAKTIDARAITKSGLMVGFGETREEVLQVMDDMRSARVDFLTIGQYLQPSPKHAPVARYWTPEEFDGVAAAARAKGFGHVAASPMTRSSYHAGEDFARLRSERRDPTL